MQGEKWESPAAQKTRTPNHERAASVHPAPSSSSRSRSGVTEDIRPGSVAVQSALPPKTVAVTCLPGGKASARRLRGGDRLASAAGALANADVSGPHDVRPVSELLRHAAMGHRTLCLLL
eukprot:CAMPEP_0175359494 /NCGR_PEP_ID=MMETSP0095-20121207/15546_1 /TAXON_ID=311494 /ORGANISM="Alexandrium monilatum, Strain CCMP3105" /LENGTH=119 /DNA_ID=CAMNT_0016657263 /DNA_START=197 /DNA_END=554 /DNA_ORIENTATION=+